MFSDFASAQKTEITELLLFSICHLRVFDSKWFQIFLIKVLLVPLQGFISLNRFRPGKLQLSTCWNLLMVTNQKLREDFHYYFGSHSALWPSRRSDKWAKWHCRVLGRIPLTQDYRRSFFRCLTLFCNYFCFSSTTSPVSQSEWCASCKVVLTWRLLIKNRCDHSNKTSLVVFSQGTIWSAEFFRMKFRTCVELLPGSETVKIQHWTIACEPVITKHSWKS